MNIRTQLLKAHSRTNADVIQFYVQRCPEALPELMACLFSDQVAVAQRAAMVVGNFGRQHPDRLRPWWSDLVELIQAPVHAAITRAVVRYFSELALELPAKLESRLIDCCLHAVADPNEKTATCVFAMQFVADRAPQYPQSAARLNAALIRRIPQGSAGFQSRGKKVLRQLQEFL
jgi:hypothetical protein